MRKLMIMTMTAAAVLLLAGCATAFTKGGSEYREGKKALGKKDYVTAVEKTIEALEKNPEFEEARAQLPQAFNEGNSHYTGIIESARASGNPFANDEIWPAYESMNRMHAAMSKGGIGGYDLKDFSEEATAARMAAIEAHYKAGADLLSKGDYKSARAAAAEFKKVSSWEKEYKDVQVLLIEAPYTAGLDLLSIGDYASAREALNDLVEVYKMDPAYKDIEALINEADDLATLTIDVYYYGNEMGVEESILNYIENKDKAYLETGTFGTSKSGSLAVKEAKKNGSDLVLFVKWKDKFKNTGKDSGKNAKRLVFLPSADAPVCKGAAKHWGFKRDITAEYTLYNVKTGRKLHSDKFIKNLDLEMAVNFPFFDKHEEHNFDSYGKGKYTILSVLTEDQDRAWDYLGFAYGDMVDLSRKAGYPMNDAVWLDYLENNYPDFASLAAEFNGKSYIMSATTIGWKDGRFAMLPLYEDQRTLQSLIDYKETSTDFYTGLYRIASSYTNQSTVQKTPGFDLNELLDDIYLKSSPYF